MKENGQMIKKMVKENTLMLMEIYMKVNGQMVKKKIKEYTFIQSLEVNMKVNG